MRIAFFSPLNPAPSGISDYSEELLPFLASEMDIELVVDGYVPTNRALADFPKRTLAEFYARASEYDVILYQMGNSPVHASILEALFKVPGVVVMHDLVLHHLRAWLTLERGKRDEYTAMMRAAYGDVGEQAARGEISGRAITDRFEFPLNEDVVRVARAIIVHSDYAARRLQSLVPNTPIGVIPMGVPLPRQISTSDARTALALDTNAFIVAAFGEIHPHKRVLPALAAFAEFRLDYPNSLFLLVGRTSPLFDVHDAARQLGVADAVRIIGYAPRSDYENYIAAADVCLNLRYPSAGETSASLLRLLGAGRVTFVTRAAASLDLPDDMCVKIEPDAYEQPLLVEYLKFFAQHPALRSAMGERAREFVRTNHSLKSAARGYAEFLANVQRGNATSRSWLLAWHKSHVTPPQLNRTTSGEAAVTKLPQIAYTPLSNQAGEHANDWKDDLAQACAELGLVQDAPLRSVAEAIVSLRLARKTEY